jgi:hypothetical protein
MKKVFFSINMLSHIIDSRQRNTTTEFQFKLDKLLGPAFRCIVSLITISQNIE